VCYHGICLAGVIHSLKNGFGFIESEGYPHNVFFHWTTVDNSDFYDLQEGQNVLFSVCETEKGPQAERVESVHAG
jgi:cold shock CspA family protein